MKILLVDDETGKRERVRDFLAEEFPNLVVVEARSFQSAVDNLLREQFALVILDMRITSYDISARDAGGRPRNLGGEELLEKMTREGIETPCYVLTQYTLFFEGRRMEHADQIQRRMREANSGFRGFIHFAQSTETWKDELKHAFKQALGDM